MNWNDVRYVLAVARTGTLSAAAEEIDVNQTTVARRLAALEEDLGARLFDRMDGRLVATTAGETVLAHAERLEEGVLALEHAVAGRDSALAGEVRLASLEGLLSAFLTPRLAEFRDLFPGIQLEMIAGPGNLNLFRREADLAIRLARPSQNTLTARKLADIGFAIYGPVGKEAPPMTAEGPWITYDESLGHLPETEWLRRTFKTPNVVLRTNSIASIAAALRAGLGMGFLPCYLGDPDRGLARLSGPVPLVVREAWLVVHPEIRTVLRIRAVSDWLVGLFKAEAALLGGSLHDSGRTC